MRKPPWTGIKGGWIEVDLYETIYTSSENSKGWDGIVKENPQGNGTYVYVAEGRDYPGKPVFKKGTVVLIR